MGYVDGKEVLAMVTIFWKPNKHFMFLLSLLRSVISILKDLNSIEFSNTLYVIFVYLGDKSYKNDNFGS